MLTQFMIMLAIGAWEPMTYPQDPPAVFYYVTEGREFEAGSLHRVERLFMNKPGENGRTSCFLYERKQSFARNAIYLAGAEMVAASLYRHGERDLFLRITDVYGKTIQEVKEVGDRIGANPDGTKIVYLTGTTQCTPDDMYYFFASTGTWIIDVRSGKSERIYPGGQDVYWSKKEDCIYISPEKTYDCFDNTFDSATGTFSKTVLRYDLKTGALTPTQFGTCRFSSDETYYVSRDSDKWLLRIHKRDTNEVVWQTSRTAQGDTDQTFALAWLSDTLLLLNKGMIVDCSRKTVKRFECKWFESEVLGTADKGTAVLVRTKDHTVTKIPLKDIPDIDPALWRPVENAPSN